MLQNQVYESRLRVEAIFYKDSPNFCSIFKKKHKSY